MTTAAVSCTAVGLLVSAAAWAQAPETFTSVVDQTSCAVLSSGRVVCWDPCDPGLSTTAARPFTRDARWRVVDGLPAVVEASGDCVRTDSGEVLCGEQDSLTASTPVRPQRMLRVQGAVQLAQGSRADMGCVRMAAGTVACWGTGPEVGDGHDPSLPTLVPDLADITALALGDSHACAVQQTGAVLCWGSNSSGEVHPADTQPRLSPTTVAGEEAAAEVVVGSGVSCVRRRDGSVACWGRRPFRGFVLPASTDAEEIDFDNGQLCVRSTGGAVACWRERQQRRGGARLARFVVTGLSSALQVGLRNGYGCARRADGTVVCWTDDVVRRSRPLAVIPGLRNAVGISVGSATSCAWTLGQHAVCWANNLTPAPMMWPATEDLAESASVGTDAQAHSCVRLAQGRVHCLGSNGEGQLGDGTFRDSPSRVPARGVTDAVRLFAGTARSCAIRRDGHVICWGRPFQRLARVRGIRDAVSVVIGGGHACALRATGAVECWGNNASGQLGDGTFDTRRSPVTVLNITTATAVAVGADFSCALRRDQTVMCWGSGDQGQLGITGASCPPDQFCAADPQASPVVVPSLSNVQRLFAGQSMACGARVDGSAQCWGQHSGDEGVVRSVAEFDGALDIGVTPTGACAVLQNGMLSCREYCDAGDGD